jgi:hypothetical protein
VTDILPPGNTPAWADSDPAADIAQIWQGDMWPALWPRLLPSYANAAARDADLVGLGALDVAFAWLKDKAAITYWTGSAWANVTRATQRGTDSITPSAANTPTKKTINLTAGMFTTPPHIDLTLITTVPGSTVTGISVDNVGASSFDVWLTRTNTTATGFQWMATA